MANSSTRSHPKYTSPDIDKVPSCVDTYGVNVIAHDPLGALSKDAFGRDRVSNTGDRLDCEFIYDKQPDLFDEVTTNGTVTHNANSRDLTLSLTAATDGSEACMTSHPVPYTPGSGQLIDLSGTLDLAEIGTGSAEVFLRSTVTGVTTEETIPQSDWIEMNTGVDWTDSHLFQLDFQSLKVGTIRYNKVVNGLPITVAQINNDNKRDGGYWQLPSLPVFWRLYIDGTETKAEIGYGDANNAIGFRYTLPTANSSATMRAICCTAKSEGGVRLQDLPGLPRTAHTGTTTASVTSSTVLTPILSIRSKDTFQSLNNLSISIPKHFSIFTNQDIRVSVIMGGTLTGASWTDVDTTYSSMEYDVTASAITGGHSIHTDFFAAATGNNNSSSSDGLLGKAVLWNRQDGDTGILTLAAVDLGTNALVRGDIGWNEIR